MNPFADPFIVFVLVLTAVIGFGTLYIDKHGRMPPTKHNDDKHGGMPPAAIMTNQFIEGLREKDTTILSPLRIADQLALSIDDIAGLIGVHHNTIRLHPESPRVQEGLRRIVRVLSATMMIQPDPNSAIFWLKNTPIPSFGHKAAYQLVAEGRTDDVIKYLESIRSGFVG